jgi:antitoxin VapB
VTRTTPRLGDYSRETPDTVRPAAKAELDREQKTKQLRERMRAWRQATPFQPPTGLKADKAFFDDLSGEL